MKNTTTSNKNFRTVVAEEIGLIVKELPEQQQKNNHLKNKQP